MKLADTVAMMNSSDYKERFKAEYQQLAIRYQGLKAMLEKWDKGELEFSPMCRRSIYNIQITAMTDYLAVLEARAVVEGVDLDIAEQNGGGLFYLPTIGSSSVCIRKGAFYCP